MGNWYHVALTLDGTTARLYVNGVLEATGATDSNYIPDSNFRIGGVSCCNGDAFAGLVDEVEVFTRALTQAEIQSIFEAGSAGKCKTPSSNFCGVISGQITDTQGPLQGALVQACEPNNGPCAFNATTDASGHYQIAGLPLNTPFDLTIFPPQGSVDVPGELLNRSVQSCGTPLANQDAMLQPPAPPSSGTSIEPNRNGGGGVPTVFWQSPLILTTTGTPNQTASYIISRGFVTFDSGSMTESPAGSGTYTATVGPFYPGHGAATVVIIIGSITIGFDIYIDPSGTVRDSHGAPISGATVTLLRSDAATGPFSVVPDGSAVMSPGNRHNPDMTDAQGHFGWDVLAGFYKVRAQHAGCNGLVETGVLQIPPPVTDLVLTLDCPTELIGAVSRKHHGAAGDLDIPLALVGGPTVECRSSGGNHTLVFTFSNDVVSGGASLTTQSGGSISGSPTFAGDAMTVNLTGVADMQKITLTLSDVTDVFSQVVPDTAVSMNLLIGDTTGSKIVNSTDVSQTKVQSGHPLSNGNCREDVDASGAINGTDVSIVKLHVGSGVP